MGQSSTYTIPSAKEKCKGVVCLNQSNESTIPHTPFNELPQGNHTVGMNPIPPTPMHQQIWNNKSIAMIRRHYQCSQIVSCPLLLLVSKTPPTPIYLLI